MQNIKERMELTLYSMVYFGFVATNYQNFGGDRGSWVYKRIIIVRCDNVIPENRQDKQLVKHLLEEKEYIVSLAIRCLRQVIKNGYRYSIPASCKSLNEDYKVDNHSFLSFYKECVIERPNKGKIEDHCTTARLYKVYEAWCIDNNNGYKETNQEVKKILKKLGKGETKKTNGGYDYYKAITLSNEAKRDYESVYYNFDYNRHDIPELDANMDDVEETMQELGLNSDNGCDFSKVEGLPTIDELEEGDLYISPERFAEIEGEAKARFDNSNNNNTDVGTNNEDI